MKYKPVPIYNRSLSISNRSFAIDKVSLEIIGKFETALTFMQSSEPSFN
jgi:hypothetical protein